MALEALKAEEEPPRDTAAPQDTGASAAEAPAALVAAAPAEEQHQARAAWVHNDVMYAGTNWSHLTY